MGPKVIVLLSGKRKSGKDFIAEKLNAELEPIAKIIRLSEPLKKEYARIHELDFAELLSSSEYKELHREKMVAWGENIRKKDPGYFCRLATANSNNYKVWIVSDCRRKTDLKYFQTEFSANRVLNQRKRKIGSNNDCPKAKSGKPNNPEEDSSVNINSDEKSANVTEGAICSKNKPQKESSCAAEDPGASKSLDRANKDIRIIKVRIEACDATRTSRGWVFTAGIDDSETECDLDSGIQWDVILNNEDIPNKAVENLLKTIRSYF